jgi:hypothetical protein
MEKVEFTQGQYHIDVFVRSAESCPVVYCLMDTASVAELAASLDEREPGSGSCERDGLGG